MGFIPHLLIFALFALLIIPQPDFGTIVVLGMICWGMMFVAGVRIWHLLTPLPVIIPVVYFWFQGGIPAHPDSDLSGSLGRPL